MTAAPPPEENDATEGPDATTSATTDATALSDDEFDRRVRGLVLLRDRHGELAIGPMCEAGNVDEHDLSIAQWVVELLDANPGTWSAVLRRLDEHRGPYKLAEVPHYVRDAFRRLTPDGELPVAYVPVAHIVGELAYAVRYGTSP